MKSELTAIFKICSWDGREWTMAVEIPREAGSFGERYVDDRTAEASMYAAVGASSMSETIVRDLVMEKRLRRDLLKKICVNLGDSLADLLENKEEWSVFQNEIDELSTPPRSPHGG